MVVVGMVVAAVAHVVVVAKALAVVVTAAVVVLAQRGGSATRDVGRMCRERTEDADVVRDRFIILVVLFVVVVEDAFGVAGGGVVEVVNVMGFWMVSTLMLPLF